MLQVVSANLQITQSSLILRNILPKLPYTVMKWHHLASSVLK